MMLRVPMSSAKNGSPCTFFFVLAAGAVSVVVSASAFLTARFVVFLAAVFVLLLRVLLAVLFPVVLAAVFVPGFLPRVLGAGFAASVVCPAGSSAVVPLSCASCAVGAGVSFKVSALFGASVSLGAVSETTASFSVAVVLGVFAFVEVFLVLGIE